jgi:hypothetical protein
VKEEDDSDESDKDEKPDISNIQSDSEDNVTADDGNTGKIPSSSRIFIGGLNNKIKPLKQQTETEAEDIDIDEILEIVEVVSSQIQNENMLLSHISHMAPHLYISIIETLLHVLKILDT